MKSLLCLVLLALIASTTFVKAARRDEEAEDDFDEDIEEGGEDEEGDDVNVAADEKEQRMRIDPCKNKKCRRGEECRLNGNVPECVCSEKCKPETDTRYHVCSTKNQTYQGECFLDRDHCRCKHKLSGCRNRRYNKVQLDYYGVCQKLTKCPKGEFEEFPFRMNEWLFVVMKQLAARSELGEYIRLLDEAKDDANHTDAVIWKFCDLDNSPQDRQVSRRELQYIVQSLKAIEHCLVPFLAKCDEDKNRRISLKEWGKCLGINPKKITDKCVDIRARARAARRH